MPQVESTWESVVAFSTSPFLAQQVSAREVPWAALKDSTLYESSPTCHIPFSLGPQMLRDGYCLGQVAISLDRGTQVRPPIFPVG